jgi:antitoxin component YwqK of YwqJK toxin-antitoxin module
MRTFLILVSAIIIYSCKPAAGCKKIGVNEHLVDSIRKASDTNLVKTYRNAEFVAAEYFVNRRDSTIAQLMKDSSGQIRQMIITKKDTRTFFAEYYKNGQLKQQFSFDVKGKLNGYSEVYFENGCMRSKGYYQHGFYNGEWENFNQAGKLMSKDVYDTAGQLLKTVAQ